MTDARFAQIVDAVRADVRSKLLDLLDEVSGRKVLLLDSTIVGPLDLIISPSDLQDHGVQNWHKLSEQPVSTDCTQMIFLVRCTRPELLDYVAAQILTDEAQGKDRLYVAVFVPRGTEQCRERLNKSNVKASVRIVECAIHFFPHDKDILSMDTPRSFYDLHAQGDPSGAFYAAKAIMSLQEKFGTIPTVHAIGKAGNIVVDVMQRLRKEEQVGQASKVKKSPGELELSQPGVPPVAPLPNGAGAIRRREEAAAQQPKPQAAPSPEGRQSQGLRISEAVVIDRQVDVFSVLCSQFTYQSLIDMVYGVSNNSTDLASAEWAQGRSKTQVRLCPDDSFYQEIRDLHIDRLGPLLQEKARAIQKTYSEKDNIKSPSEMAEYIKKFKTAQSAHPLLEIHINLAHDLKDRIQADEYRQLLKQEDDITANNSTSQSCLEFIEEMVDDQRPIHEPLRLLCLYSLVNNGVKQKHLDQLKRSIIQSYGYEHLLTLMNMERTGILRYFQGKSVWSGIKKHFNLFVEDGHADRDISYAYSGYAPLSVRLVQNTKPAMNQPSGWLTMEPALKLLAGPSRMLKQPMDPGTGEEDSSQPKVCLVVFVGGVTYGEVAALRRLSELEEGRRKFLIMTTEFTNTKKFFESLRCEEVFKQPPVEVPKATVKQQEKSRGFGFWPGSR